MPANKNAVIRYMYLDQMLSDRIHYYTRSELYRKCNELLKQDGYSEVSKRTIEMDLLDLGFAPFYMEIDDSLVINGKKIVRYVDQTQSIFSKPLSNEEKKLLNEVIKTLGQFSGLDSFAWIQDLKEKLDDKKAFGSHGFDTNSHDNATEHPIISFEENKYLKNKEYLPKLFSFISNKQTIIISYKKFMETEVKHYSVYPYLLKQYSNRWYLICTPVVDETGVYNPELVMNLPLDRFAGEVKYDKRHKFKECTVDLDERYEDIIGITYFNENPIDEIIFAVTENSAPYIETKPIHESQRVCLDTRYHIDGYKTFCIECRYNYELLSTLSSFGEGLIVLSPAHLRKKMIDRIKKQLKGYKIANKLKIWQISE